MASASPDERTALLKVHGGAPAASGLAALGRQTRWPARWPRSRERPRPCPSAKSHAWPSPRLPVSIQRGPQNRLRAERHFASALNVIWAVQSAAEKYRCFFFPEFVLTVLVPPRSRGAHRDRHERWVRDTMGAADCSMLVMRTNSPLRTVKSRGPDIPTLISRSRARRGLRPMVARSRRTRENAKQPLKPLCRGGRECPAAPVVPAPCNLFARGPRVSVDARPSLRPPSRTGAKRLP
jgi:hypothetical protein